MEWLLILFFGAVSAICLERKEKEAQKTREKKRRQQLLLEYPGMVEQITVLLESGMTIRRAWKQMIGREPGASGQDLSVRDAGHVP